MANVSIDRPHYGYHDEAKIVLVMNPSEAAELARLVQEARPAGIPSVGSWINDFVRLANW